MSMTSDDLENQEDDPKGLRNAVEAAKREAAEAKAELDSLKRKDAFRSAGLDFTNPVHKAVADGYSGEVDGISTFVSGLGLDQQVSAPAVPSEEQAAMERMTGIATGDGGGIPADADAEGNSRLKAIVDKGRAEGWGQYRFNEEFRAEMVRQGRPVAQLDYEHVKPSR